ncbi:hypothetical protein ES702_03948 [subsurface metagenome]
MRRIANIITVVLFLQIAPSISCLELGTGLETGGDMRVCIAVETMSEDARQTNLSRELIKSKVELQLRRNGITPTDYATGIELGYFLYININIVGSAFGERIAFCRRVTYMVGNKRYEMLATTWHKGATGRYADNPRLLIDDLLDDIDIFCSEFLSANGK